jgi:hypothetical protein
MKLVDLHGTLNRNSRWAGCLENFIESGNLPTNPCWYRTAKTRHPFLADCVKANPISCHLSVNRGPSKGSSIHG